MEQIGTEQNQNKTEQKNRIDLEKQNRTKLQNRIELEQQNRIVKQNRIRIAEKNSTEYNNGIDQKRIVQNKIENNYNRTEQKNKIE